MQSSRLGTAPPPTPARKSSPRQLPAELSPLLLLLLSLLPVRPAPGAGETSSQHWW
jgi:hypothetical protein